MPVTNVCRICEADKPLDEYSIRNDNGKYRTECKPCLAKKTKLWYKENKERFKPINAKWAASNRDKKNASEAKRRAAKLQRTVAWGNKDLIDDVYARAKRLTEATGIPMEVDHIYPLQGAMVSGLHVENNLQILPKAVNASKSNKFKVQ